MNKTCNHDSCNNHDEQVFEDTITTIVVLSMLGAAVAYLWVITTYIYGWPYIGFSFHFFLVSPSVLLFAGATFIIFRK